MKKSRSFHQVMMEKPFRKHSYSLYLQVLVVLLLVVVAVTTPISYLGHRQLMEALEREAADHFTAIVLSNVQICNTWIDDLVSRTISYSNFFSISEYSTIAESLSVNFEEFKNTLSLACYSSYSIRNLYITNAKGKVLLQGVDYIRADETIRNLIQTKAQFTYGAYIQPFYYDEQELTHRAFIYHPISIKGVVGKGYFVTEMNPRHLSTILQSPEGKDSRTIILDNKLQMIAKVGGDRAEAAIVLPFTEKELEYPAGTGRFQSRSGAELFAAHRWVERFNYVVMVVSSAERVFRPASRSLFFVYLITANSIIIFLLFSLVLLFLMVRPLRSVAVYAHELAQGNYSVRLPAKRSDEIGNLERSFNFMASRIERSMEQIRRSENYYRRIIEGSADLILLARTDGTIEYASPSIVKRLGYTEELVLGTSVTDYLAEEGRKDFVYLVDRELLKIGDSVHIQTEVLANNNRWLRFDFFLTCIGDIPGGVDRRIIFNGRDITEQEKAEKKNLHMRQYEAMNLLSARFAHNFSNILTGVLGKLTLLQMDIEAGRSMKKLTTTDIHTEISKARDQTRQLLLFSDGFILRTVSCSAVEIYEKMKKRFDASKQNRLRDGHGLDSMLVEVDANLVEEGLFHVVDYMVSNSLQKPVVVSGDRGAEAFYYSVSIDEVIFQPYETEELFLPHMEEKSDSLGLSLAYLIIKKHGGDITAVLENNISIIKVRIPQ